MTARLFDPPHGQGIEAWQAWRDKMRGLQGDDAIEALAHAGRMIAIMEGERDDDRAAWIRLRDGILAAPPKNAP